MNSVQRLMIRAYTDGSWIKSLSAGGWGFLIRTKVGDAHLKIEQWGGSKSITQNHQRMELTAMTRCLETLPAQATSHITSDSEYVLKSLVRDGNGSLIGGRVTGWIAIWKRNGWQTSSQKPVKHQDLWKRCLAAIGRLHQNGTTVRFSWVKSHSGVPLNDRVDALAKQGARKAGRKR